ncbi:GntR family transcriptional regulator [Actinoalloteichus caeruleus]|uniref:GntR family transcriptional regulator n=1 Tax=Actinoalloteichus cyanogriseus TaxID=2893586 RepID=UPI003AABE53F
MPVPHPTQPQLRRTLLRDTAFHLLRDAIVTGTLAPGERLRDTELEHWLGVSRTPIREALARLEQAGLVHTVPGRSTVVAPLNPRQVHDAQLVVSAMHELAVREATPHLGPTHHNAMRTANHQLAAALEAGDPDAAIAADDAFHSVAVSAAANHAITAVLDQFTPLLRRVERLRFSALTGRDSVAQHDHILNLCTQGDAENAARATRTNWNTLRPLLDLPTTPAPHQHADDEGHRVTHPTT